MNNNGSFTKLLTTISDIDDNSQITVTTEFEFKPRGKDYDGFYANLYMRDTSFEIIQWGKIPISKATRGDGWGQQFYEFYGTVTATDVPTIQLGTNFKSAFQNSRVTIIPNMHLWDMSKVVNAENMFYKAGLFNTDISTWDTSRMTNMNSMFYGAGSFNCGLPVPWQDYIDDRHRGNGYHRQNINTKEVTVNGKTYIAWDVSKMTNMFEMFLGCGSFNSDISNWNTSNVTMGNALFQGVGSFNCGNNDKINPNDTENGGLPERTIDTKIVTIGTGERQITYKAWDITGIDDMRLMFTSTYAFNNDLNNWDMRNVKRGYKMFQYSHYNGDITKWNTIGLTTAYSMFNQMPYFNRDISTKTIDVTNPDNYIPTFDYSGKINSSESPTYGSMRNPDLPDSYVAWDVTGISLMTGMVSSVQFKQNIRNWNVQEGTDTTNMFTSEILAGEGNDFGLTTVSPPYDWFQPVPGQINATRINISGTFKFKVNETQWNNNPKLPVENGNGSFVSTDVTDSSVVTVSSSDTGGNVTVTYNYTYEEQRATNFDSHSVISNLTNDGFRTSAGINHNSVIITQWDNIPLSRGGLQFQSYQGSIDTNDIPTVLSNTTFQSILKNTTIEIIPYINDWNISNVTSLTEAFYGATQFNSDISEWDTSNILYCNQTFYNATNFNQNISAKLINKNNSTYVAWNTKKVKTFENMFNRATNFNNGELSNNRENPLYLDTTSITSMKSMFEDCSNFNQSMPRNVITLTSGDFSYNLHHGTWK